MALTAKQQRFVEEYMIDLNATQAAIRSGYSANTAMEQGYQLLQKTSVQEAIQKAMEARSKRTQITADRVLEEYAKIGFSNITDYLKVNDRQVETDTGTETYQVVEIFGTDGIEKEKLAAVSEIKQTKEGIALKLHDKKGALDSIARHLGMFVDKQQVEHSGAITIEKLLEQL